jgi:TorA maturation chaperone TorD
MMPSDTFAGEEVARTELRGWVYRHLAILFDSIPESLPRPAPAGGAAGGGSGMDAYPRTLAAIERLLEIFAAQSREQMQAEQTRLFLNAPGGVVALPYASWYLDGFLLGPACDWAAEEYSLQSLESDPAAGEPADFIAIELEYMFFLCRHERAARLTGDQAALAAATQAQARFFFDHLIRWLPKFVERLRAGSPRGVYLALAQLLEAFLVEEGQQLAGTPPALREPLDLRPSLR